MVSDVKVCNDTPINNVVDYRSSSVRKDKLTIYISEKLIDYCNSFVVVATRENVLSNRTDFIPRTGVSSHEEADTLMLHALEIVNSKPGRKQTSAHKILIGGYSYYVVVLSWERQPA